MVVFDFHRKPAKIRISVKEREELEGKGRRLADIYRSSNQYRPYVRGVGSMVGDERGLIIFLEKVLPANLKLRKEFEGEQIFYALGKRRFMNIYRVR